MSRRVQSLTMEKKSDNPTSEEVSKVHTPHQICQIFKSSSKGIFLVVDNISFYFAGYCGMLIMDYQ